MFLMGKLKEFDFGHLSPVNPTFGPVSVLDLPNLRIDISCQSTGHRISFFYILKFKWEQPGLRDPAIVASVILEELRHQVTTALVINRNEPPAWTEGQGFEGDGDVSARVRELIRQASNRCLKHASMNVTSDPWAKHKAVTNVVLPFTIDGEFRLCNQPGHGDFRQMGVVQFLGEQYSFGVAHECNDTEFPLIWNVSEEQYQQEFIEAIHTHFPWILPAADDTHETLDEIRKNLFSVNLILFFDKRTVAPEVDQKKLYRSGPQQGNAAAEELSFIIPVYVHRQRVLVEARRANGTANHSAVV